MHWKAANEFTFKITGRVLGHTAHWIMNSYANEVFLDSDGVLTGYTGEERWMVTDVVGLEEGLGVECLSGSGAIASAYAKAYKEGLTITLVSGRTVGIGAYLARLGRRCVQRADQPIILTGYAALNKLLGREVYTSHMQLGGPKVSTAPTTRLSNSQTQFILSCFVSACTGSCVCVSIWSGPDVLSQRKQGKGWPVNVPAGATEQ